MSIRPPTHAGSWYSSSRGQLDKQMTRFLDAAPDAIKGARVLIGPHAGYSYAGETLAETYKAWDATDVKRVFIMGPSHHVYFKGHVKLTGYEAYQTPLGNVPVDTEIVKDLLSRNDSLFKVMSEQVDEDEHSFEMHMPYIYKMTENLQKTPTIIPIMISHSDEDFEKRLASYLAPYFADRSNTFVISTDFCHWGDRFGYTMYTSGDPFTLTDVGYSLEMKPNSLPIYKSIEILDKEAMKIMSTISYKSWKHYLKVTSNTICGAKPLSVLISMMEDSGKADTIKWLGYAQSNKVSKPFDSSVSYASGYAIV